MKKIGVIFVFLFVIACQDNIYSKVKFCLNEITYIEENIINCGSDFKIEKPDSIEAWAQIPLNLSANLYSILFIDDSTGFAVGFKPDEWYSIIINTTDRGNSWTRCNINTRVNINSITSINSNTLIAVGGGWNGIAFESVILKTTNQGATWSRVNLSEEKAFTAVSFLPNGIGVIVGELEIVYLSTDGGTSWILKHSGTHWTESLADVCFLDTLSIVAVGAGGKILVSHDLGNNWESLNSTTTKSLYGIENTSGNFYIAGESGLVLFSDDSCNTWQTQTNVTTAHLYGIHFTSTNNGFIVGGRNDLPGNKNVTLNTTDAGLTWQKQSYSSNYILNDVYFINELVGFAVGNSGLILKTTNGGVTFIDEENNFTQPGDFLLQQNYPNPFNPSTKIKYKIPSVGTRHALSVQLKVYDLLGREIATLVNEEKPAGSYEIDFQSIVGSHQLANGVYFYQLRVGDPWTGSGQSFVETKKMILLK